MIAARALADKKAISISVLQISDLTVMADYFVICTGSSTTHLKTLADAVQKALEDRARSWAMWRDGEAAHGCSWIRVSGRHLFMAETRAFYDLERPVADAPPYQKLTVGSVISAMK